MHQVIFEPGVYQEKKDRGRKRGGGMQLDFFLLFVCFEERMLKRREKKEKRLIREKEKEREKEREERFYAVEVFSLWSSIHHEKGEVTSSSLLMFLLSQSSRSLYLLFHSRPEKCLCSLLSQESELHVWFSKKKAEKKEEKNVSSDERWGKIDTKM